MKEYLVIRQVAVNNLAMKVGYFLFCLLLAPLFVELPRKSGLNSNEWINTAISHGLQVT